MKVVFFSESQINGKIERLCYELSVGFHLDAPHYNINNLPSEKFDLGIVIIPKNYPNVDLDVIVPTGDNAIVHFSRNFSM